MDEDNNMVNPVIPEEGKADEVKTDEVKADEAKADETKVDETKVDETKAKEVDYVYKTPVQDSIENGEEENTYSQSQKYFYDTNTAYNPDYQQKPQEEHPMTVGDWVITLLAICLPCVGLLIYIYWAVSKETNVNRQNFCRAWLIVVGIILVLWLIFFGTFGMILATGLY